MKTELSVWQRGKFDPDSNMTCLITQKCRKRVGLQYGEYTYIVNNNATCRLKDWYA